MKYFGYFGTALMIVAAFCGLNDLLFAVSSAFGMPMTIAGMGWTIDTPVLGATMFQIIGTLIGFAISFQFDPNNETAAKYRVDRAKVEAIEKMERIGDGARATVGAQARAGAGSRRVRVSDPKPAPAYQLEAKPAKKDAKVASATAA